MAVAFSTDLSTFVPERPIYAIGENSNGSLAWMTNQLMDFQISVDSEEDTKTDAQGNTIFSISKAKSCNVSFTSPLFTIDLVAEMNGSSVDRGTSIVAPKFETVKLVAKENKVVIGGTYTTIYFDKLVVNSGTIAVPAYRVSATLLTKDGSAKKKLVYNKTATQSSQLSAGEFMFTEHTGDSAPANKDNITILNSDYVDVNSILITYEYTTTNAIQMINSAEEFPVASIVKVLVRGYDVCD